MKGIYFILTVQDPIADLVLLRRVIDSGISAVQLRAKSGIDQSVAQEMQRICHDHSVLFIVNDDARLALNINADGVHLGQTDMPLPQARRLIGPRKILGATAPTPDLIRKAAGEGADYVGVGHVFPTTTKKKDGPPIGFKGVEEAVKVSPIPVVAIGGLHKEALLDIHLAGASCAAICAAISQAADPFLAAKELVQMWPRECLKVTTFELTESDSHRDR